MRYPLAHALLMLSLLLTMPACDSPKKDGAGSASGSAKKPAVQLVVRAVDLQRSVTGKPPGGAKEEQTWSAPDGKMYAIVTVDILHNECAAGDKIESKHASLILPKEQRAEVTGGGAKKDELCIQCHPSRPLSCSGGQAPMAPFIFVFAVEEATDMSQAKLRYRDEDAALADATISDKRGNAEIEAQIKAKKDKIKRLKKKLENTGSESAGKLILGEIDEIKRDIANLEKKQLQ